MTPKPDRQLWIRSLEPQWDAAILSYYQQFPSHPSAGEWLAANPTPGVIAVMFAGSPYLEGWPDGTPFPDIDGWIAQQAQVAADAAKSTQAALDAQAAADATSNEAKSAQNASYQAGIDHLTATLATEKDPTQQYLLQIAIDGAKRLMLP